MRRGIFGGRPEGLAPRLRARSESASTVHEAADAVQPSITDGTKRPSAADATENGAPTAEAEAASAGASSREGVATRRRRTASARGVQLGRRGDDAVEIEGVVRRITFRSGTTGYTVARIDASKWSNAGALLSGSKVGGSGEGGTCVVIGDNIQALNVGQRVIIDGVVTKHQKYGRRVKVTSWREMDRRTLSTEEAVAYLAGILPGVGAATATKMIARFGSVADVFKILDGGGDGSAETIEQKKDRAAASARRLSEIPGITMKKAERMISKWDETRNLREASRFLQDLGLQTGLSERLALKYGNDTVALVEADPFKALRGVRGGNWEAMESIAARLSSIRRNHVSRVLVAVEFALMHNAQVYGNTFGYCHDVVNQALEALNSNRLADYSTKGVGPAAGARGDGEDEMGMLTAEYVLEVVRRHGDGVIVIEDGDDGNVEARRSVTRRGAWGDRYRDRDPLRSRMYLARLHQAEMTITDAVMQRIASAGHRREERESCSAVDGFISRAEEKNGIVLSDEQKDVLRTAARERMMIITGGPGSGKTLVTNFIAQYFLHESGSAKLRLCAPTARAAIRLQTITNMEATTIHRLLGYESKEAALAAADGGNKKNTAVSGASGGGSADTNDGVDLRQTLFYNSRDNKSVFKYNSGNVLDAEVVIVDESSMIDIVLMESLLNAIGSSCKLIVFVGDADQLPPVGPGSPFKCLLASGVVPTIRLNHIYRQENDFSLIVDSAYKINQGVVPSIERVRSDWNGEGEEWPLTDCLWVDVNGGNALGGPAAPPREYGEGQMSASAQIASAVEDLIGKFVPAMGYDVSEDVQVMAPGRRGAAGCTQLNRILQPLLNAEASAGGGKRLSMDVNGEVYRVGDRVMQTENDYDRDIFNGDQGVVTNIASGGNSMTVEFPTLLKPSVATSSGSRRSSAKKKGKEVVRAGDRDGYRRIEYSRPQVRDSLMLAWCTTVHKAQGGEYPVVILALSPEHRMLNNRRLLYTGITRAKKLCILVSTERSLSNAVMTRGNRDRLTWLDARVRFASKGASLGVDGGGGAAQHGDRAGVSVSADEPTFEFSAALYRADESGALDFSKGKEFPGVSHWVNNECFRIQGYASEGVAVAAIAVSEDADSGKLIVDVLYPSGEEDKKELTAHVPGLLNDFWEVDNGDGNADDGINVVLVFASRDGPSLFEKLDEFRGIIVEEGERGMHPTPSDGESQEPLFCGSLRRAAADSAIAMETFQLKSGS